MYNKIMRLVIATIIIVMVLISSHVLQENTTLITEENIATLDMISYTAVYAMIAMIVSNLLTTLVATSVGMFSWIPKRLEPLGEAVARYGVWLAAFTVIAPLWGTTAQLILGGLGVAGIGVAVGAQTTLQNLFGFGKIVMTSPFEEGDTVTVAGVKGTVSDINTLDTTIETGDGSMVNVPNSLFSTEAVIKHKESAVSAIFETVDTDNEQ